MEVFLTFCLLAWIAVVYIDTRQKRRIFLRDHK